MPYTSALTGELVESTWDRHPPNGAKARVWRREDADADTTYPWFYVLPHGGIGSIARTWGEAMSRVNAAYAERWLAAAGLGQPQ